MKKLFIVIGLVVALAFFNYCNTPGGKKLTEAEKDSSYNKLTDEEKRLPENALLGIEMASGLEASLFASEPMIGNPTNIDVDAKGRVWMCEAFNYRPDLNPDHPVKAKGDRILILEDTDGDGKADTSKVFYQGTDVNAALGIAVLGNKVIVSCSPNVFVFTDENGDDIPEKKEVLFTHVGGEQHDHAVHAFTFGADGKLYFNFGNAGEQLMDKDGNLVKDKEGIAVTNKGLPYRQGMVFRMNTDGTGLEVLGHNFRNNYEVATDAFGTMWQSDNDDDGNKSTRVNYVMEYGNYGYTDEITGAGWQARRTNMEAEIPGRHWHQNDPGTIPNLLVTGAGSPAGMCVYEGHQLPKIFNNQMIHAEAGNNVVRAYPVANAGAGYTAKIEPLMTGKRDQWFRPVDVCTAPDGSLMVADWYDPGVGGHQMADMNRGRIFRVAATGKTKYKVQPADVSTPEAAVKALNNPNGATRYLAFTKLQSWGEKAGPALLTLYNGSDVRAKARSLWLLARIAGKQDEYLRKALADKEPEIRITAIRAARQIANDVIPYLQVVINDNNYQVLREVAIALHHNTSPQAPALWAKLAQKYDGNDRWYLEALGIGADKQWNTFMAAWQNADNQHANPAVIRDIVWRSRSPKALTMLAGYIQNSQTSQTDRLRFFRAFDFIEGPEKNIVLLAMLNDAGPERQQIILPTLLTLDSDKLTSTDNVQNALSEALATSIGTREFVELVRKYKLTNKNEELLSLALRYSDSSLGYQAASSLVASGGSALLKSAIKASDTARAFAALKTLSKGGTKESLEMMKAIITDASVQMPLRERAIKMLARGWNESEQLLNMIKANKISKELSAVATDALATSYRKEIRNEALKYGNIGGAGGQVLPGINVLASLSGDAASGQQVFVQTCSSCHKVGNQGVSFGPALSVIGSKLTKDALYISIIHPDAGISFGYEGNLFTLKDGNIVAGIIISETGDAVEVNTPGGAMQKIQKTQIATRKQMDNSMMPSTLHQTMTKQQLVNLVEYLTSLKDKATAAN